MGFAAFNAMPAGPERPRMTFPLHGSCRVKPSWSKLRFVMMGLETQKSVISLNFRGDAG